jgi:transposase
MTRRILLNTMNTRRNIIASSDCGSVCDHRLGYQHARPTDIIAAFNFLHHIFADDFQ